MPEFEKVAFELEASSTGSPKWGEAKTSEGEFILYYLFQADIRGLLFSGGFIEYSLTGQAIILLWSKGESNERHIMFIGPFWIYQPSP